MNLIRTSIDQYLPDSPESRLRGDTHSPEISATSPKESTEPFMNMLFSGWNPDLPDPAVLDHLCVFMRIFLPHSF